MNSTVQLCCSRVIHCILGLEGGKVRGTCSFLVHFSTLLWISYKFHKVQKEQRLLSDVSHPDLWECKGVRRLPARYHDLDMDSLHWWLRAHFTFPAETKMIWWLKKVLKKNKGEKQMNLPLIPDHEPDPIILISHILACINTWFVVLLMPKNEQVKCFPVPVLLSSS